MERTIFKGVCCALLAVGLPLAGLAQNLVPNPSFEEYTECPDNFNQIDRVADWSGLFGSPDYFNTCSPWALGFGVPLNVAGYQSAFSGDGYIGVVTYDEAGAREYVQARLAVPLEVGIPVHISLRIAPGGFGIPEWASPIYTSKSVGVAFSTRELSYALHETNMAALFHTTVLTDTLDWTLLSGEYIPDSAYAYIQLGNFFADILSEPTVIDPNGESTYAYVYFDQVCVSATAGICEISTGFSSLASSRFPFTDTFFNDDIMLHLETGPNHIQLMDPAGRICIDQRTLPVDGLTSVSTTHLSDGIYLLRILRPNGRIGTQRLLHVSP